MVLKLSCPRHRPAVSESDGFGRAEAPPIAFPIHFALVVARRTGIRPWIANPLHASALGLVSNSDSRRRAASVGGSGKLQYCVSVVVAVRCRILESNDLDDGEVSYADVLVRNASLVRGFRGEKTCSASDQVPISR